ncbi:conserved hypothetical protein [Methylorubrum extorquens AM1]|jgi:hypothetical protein|uniref:Uncharacterized protein n=1 Tax=Methylorubrum extorquens (strain ATCC 14718 / DSM 1338 / JCM 2805 / NCIMB 9133 / AM1) TaxID=272630 RepID=C5B0H6_METEA|nr:conserved hypothetical protein [Methylorubrum extorquens AM1]
MLPPLQKESSVEAGHQTLGSAENPVPVGHAAGAEVGAGHALQGLASRSRIAEICPAKINTASRARFRRPSEREERSHFEWA